MRRNYNQPDNICICLVGGVEHEYDYATTDKAKPAGHEYIGQGIIHSVDGVAQDIHETYHFWRKAQGKV